MFGSLMALPVLGLRVLAELALLVVALTVVIRAHRKAGLAMGAGAGLALLGSLAAPLFELSAIGLVASSPNGNAPDGAVMGMVALMLVGAWVPFVAQAINLGLVSWGVVMLVRRIPADQRDDLGGAIG